MHLLKFQRNLCAVFSSLSTIKSQSIIRSSKRNCASYIKVNYTQFEYKPFSKYNTSPGLAVTLYPVSSEMVNSPAMSVELSSEKRGWTFENDLHLIICIRINQFFSRFKTVKPCGNWLVGVFARKVRILSAGGLPGKDILEEDIWWRKKRRLDLLCTRFV